MTIWRRWSWPYRTGALFALLLLLQGAACPRQDQGFAYLVPGVGRVAPTQYINHLGQKYYLVYDTNSVEPDRAIHEGTPEFEYVEQFFRSLFQNQPSAGDRAGLPGGTGVMPAPPVQ